VQRPTKHQIATWMWRVVTLLLIVFNALAEAHRQGML
jgi:hypothetical protein